MDFNTVVSSGLSVGVPGTPALWDAAARDFGTRRLADAARSRPSGWPATGFVVDQTFHDQTADNAARFAKFPETAKVFLPGGKAPAVGLGRSATPTWPGPTASCGRRASTRSTAGALGRDDRRRGAAPARPRPASASCRGQMTTRDLAAYRGADQGADPLAVQGLRRLRHAGAELGRHRRRRDPQPHRGLRAAHRHEDLRGRQRRLPAPLLGGVRDRVRRPQPLRR